MADDPKEGKVLPFKGPVEEKSGSEKKKNRSGMPRDIVVAAAGAVLAAAIIAAVGLVKGFFTLPDRMKTVEDGITTMREKTIPGLEEDIGRVGQNLSDDKENLRDGIDRLGDRLDNLYLLLLKDLRLEASGEYSRQIAAGLGNKNSICQDEGPTITRVVARSGSGTEYTSQELLDLKLLLPYRDGDKNGYFYGQFNENDHWDGNCVVNIYRRGELELITDAVYDDGRLRSCKQVFPDTTTGGRPIWVISDRVVEDGFSRGETWHCFREEPLLTIPEPEDVGTGDIITVDGFSKRLRTGIEGYYRGMTSDGKFNDATGTAYMVKYFDSGLIRTLYAGSFKNGVFDDASGDAWMIGKKNEDQSAYSYYKGPFQNGQYTGGSECWRNGLTQEDIEELLADSGVVFPDEILKWGPSAP